jgi:hypothetical protein
MSHDRSSGKKHFQRTATVAFCFASSSEEIIAMEVQSRLDKYYSFSDSFDACGIIVMTEGTTLPA